MHKLGKCEWVVKNEAHCSIFPVWLIKRNLSMIQADRSYMIVFDLQRCILMLTQVNMKQEHNV